MLFPSGDRKSLYSIFVGIVCFAAFLFVWFNPFFRKTELSTNKEITEPLKDYNRTDANEFRSDPRLVERDIPDSVISTAKTIGIQPSSKIVNIIAGGNEYQIAYREPVMPKSVVVSGQTVLLLHGTHFSSNTWTEDTQTLQHLTAMGHTAIAVDLPGFGDSPKSQVNQTNKGMLIKMIIQTMELERPVLVAPSMSGAFAFPILLKEPNLFGGFVPIAPFGVANVKPSELAALTVPTMIVYGEEDEGGAHTSRKLKTIPKSSMYMIPGAPHAAYLHNKELWNKLLYNFLLILKEGKW